MTTTGDDHFLVNIGGSNQTGIIFPLYVYPDWYNGPNWGWSTVINAKLAFPQIPMVAIINVNSGPDTTVNSDYTTGLSGLVSLGIKVLGYTFTTYGVGVSGTTTHNESQIQLDIDRWKSFYPQIQGIMFDEMAPNNNSGGIAFYTRITSYAKATKGFQMVRGNPGNDFTVPTMFCGMDLLGVREVSGYPQFTQAYKDTYSAHKSKLDVVGHDMNGLTPFTDTTFFQNANKYAAYVYITEDGGANPYDTVTAQLSGICSLLLKNNI